jgi:hypothetical protein
MLADIGAPRATILPVLHDIDLFAGRKGADAKAGKRVIPKELTIFPSRASEGIYRAFAIRPCGMARARYA